MSTTPVRASRPPSGRSSSTSSSVRAIGAWSSGVSGLRPVAFATMPSSQRSGGVRWRMPARSFARSATRTGAALAAPSHAAANAGEVRSSPIARTLDEAGSNTKSYSLALPAHTTSSPSVCAHVTRLARRLGWSPSTGVHTFPAARALCCRIGPTTEWASFETMATCFPAAIASMAQRAPDSGLPVASTITSSGNSVSSAASGTMATRPAWIAASAAARESQIAIASVASPADKHAARARSGSRSATAGTESCRSTRAR